MILATPTVLGASLHQGRPATVTVGPVQSAAETRCTRDILVAHPPRGSAQQLRKCSHSRKLRLPGHDSLDVRPVHDLRTSWRRAAGPRGGLSRSGADQKVRPIQQRRAKARCGEVARRSAISTLHCGAEPVLELLRDPIWSFVLRAGRPHRGRPRRPAPPALDLVPPSPSASLQASRPVTLLALSSLPPSCHHEGSSQTARHSGRASGTPRSA